MEHSTEDTIAKVDEGYLNVTIKEYAQMKETILAHIAHLKKTI